MSLKNALHEMHTHLTELETHARKLPNQNFADIVKSAHGKVAQLVHHPDVDNEHFHPEEHERGPFGS